MLGKIICAVLVLMSGSVAISSDLFDGTKPRALRYGDPISATDTLGGYAIYPGDGRWTYVSSKAGTASTGAGDITNIGVIQMMQVESHALLARQTLTVNIGSGSGSSWSGSPCSPGHLVSRNQGHGRYDNCMTIDAINLTVDNVLVLFLSVVLTNSGANGRYYKVVLDLNPALLGMRGTTLGDWAPEVLATRETQQAFLKRLSDWAEILQDRSIKAFDYSQPKDAYADVRSFRTLAPIPVVTVDKRVPQVPSSAVENGVPEGLIDRIPFKVGDTIQTVKSALKTSIDLEPTVYATPKGVPDPNEGKTNLYLRSKGIRVFFNKDGIVEIIRLEPPFPGTIAGVKLGDTEKMVRDLKGKPLKTPWQFGDAQAFLYVLDDAARVRFDISEKEGVQTIFILH